MNIDVKDLRKGDWIRFLSNGDLFIGVVEYLVKDPAGVVVNIITTGGPVKPTDVLEIRK